MQLPEEFQKHTRQLLGDERYEVFVDALQQEPPTSIRMNPTCSSRSPFSFEARVPWCQGGLYLPERPNFTLDPLFHAGLYYVQEASSMFLDLVLRQHLPTGPVNALDLCAAPGGKSTIIQSLLPAGSTLVSNEPIRPRAQILAENMQKWTLPSLYQESLQQRPRQLPIVTNNFPADFSRARCMFDIILCDVPCSGEGMFRKDPDAIKLWSTNTVEKCQRLQREIVIEAWKCLKPGGLLIYSTCTFNTRENEENIQWMISEEFGATPLCVDIDPAWQITGSLLPGFHAPVYRFIPGFTKGEGLFMVALRKEGTSKPSSGNELKGLAAMRLMPDDFIKEISNSHPPLVNVPRQQALQYLHREAIVLPPETSRGMVCVAFDGHPLGLAKNLGTRANNLYPKQWRIKTSYINN